MPGQPHDPNDSPEERRPSRRRAKVDVVAIIGIALIIAFGVFVAWGFGPYAFRW